MTHLSAVLTGDLINSRKLTPAGIDRAISEIAGAVSDYTGLFTFDPKFTRFRGDGWQLLLPSPERALALAVFIKARLKARGVIPTRISIGVGTVERAHGTDLASAAGPAFAISGEGLDTMDRTERLRIAGPGVTNQIVAIAGLIEWMSDRWSAKMAEAVTWAMLRHHQTNEGISRQLGITRQAFEARLNGAGYQPIHEALEAVRQHPFGLETQR